MIAKNPGEGASLKRPRFGVVAALFPGGGWQPTRVHRLKRAFQIRVLGTRRSGVHCKRRIGIVIFFLTVSVSFKEADVLVITFTLYKLSTLGFEEKYVFCELKGSTKIV